MTFEEWRSEVGRHAEELLGLGDALDEDDPYELFESMPGAHAAGQDPEAFVREMFADDLASLEHDELLRQESMAYADTDPPEGQE